MIKYVGIIKANHGESELLKSYCPLGIIRLAIGMGISIEFYDWPGGRAIKVDDKAINWNLAAELDPIHLPIAEPRPQNLFGRRGITSQLFGALQEFGMYSMLSHHPKKSPSPWPSPRCTGERG